MKTLRTIRAMVFDALNKGQTIDDVWDGLNRRHWNYLNALRREWEIDHGKSSLSALKEAESPADE